MDGIGWTPGGVKYRAHYGADKLRPIQTLVFVEGCPDPKVAPFLSSKLPTEQSGFQCSQFKPSSSPTIGVFT